MKKYKQIISLILILLCTVPEWQIFASEDITPARENVFEQAQIQAEEADENGSEYEGFIFMVEEPSGLDADNIEGIELLDENSGLFTADSIEAIEETVPEDAIDYIEPDYLMELFDEKSYSADPEKAPNDEKYTSQWNLESMNVQALWDQGIEGQDLDLDNDLDYDGDPGNDRIIVAIIDSGLNVSHEDIDSGRIVNPRNMVEESAAYKTSDVTDNVGHGTFAAGEIMARKNNVVGIAGIGQSIYVMPVKVFDSTTSKTSGIVNAINYITSERLTFDRTGGAEGTDVSVINISFGGKKTTESLKNAVASAISAGIIVVCAAGNFSTYDAVYPAMYAIGVASYGRSGSISSFSQKLSEENGDGYENKVWVSAPGENITSAYATGNSAYHTASGTSYSGPEVAALAAICKGLNNSIDHTAFKKILKDSAVNKTSGLGDIDGQDIGYGWGCVDFKAAAELAVNLEPVYKDGWNKIDDIWYYYRNNKPVTGWLKDNGTWYYLKDSGAMATGWLKDNGKWYYLKASGAMATGWIKDKGTWYFLKASGAMAEREWVSGFWWVSSGGAWTYTYKGSWYKNRTGWWFGDTSGWYAKNETVIINNVAYTFDKNGYLK